MFSSVYTATWFAWALLCLKAVTAAGADDVKEIPLRTHSLQTPYLDSDMQSRWFDFGGDTVIRADQYIRLAADRQSQSGWIFSRVPLTATNWRIELEYKISGNGNLNGDGFAMWLTKQRATMGPVFGFVDQFEGLGIFWDTYKNNRPGTVFPYVMAMVGDGQQNYDQEHDGKENELAGCSARGLRNSQVPTKARLTYFQDQNLTLELQYRAEGDWTQCFDVPNVKIPAVSYLGFSAATGDLSDNFDIINVETKNLYTTGGGSSGSSSGNQQASKPGSTSSRGGQKEGGSWSWFFLKIILLLLAVAGSYVGYTMYRTSQRSSRF